MGNWTHGLWIFFPWPWFFLLTTIYGSNTTRHYTKNRLDFHAHHAQNHASWNAEIIFLRLQFPWWCFFQWGFVKKNELVIWKKKLNMGNGPSRCCEGPKWGLPAKILDDEVWCPMPQTNDYVEHSKTLGGWPRIPLRIWFAIVNQYNINVEPVPRIAERWLKRKRKKPKVKTTRSRSCRNAYFRYFWRARASSGSVYGTSTYIPFKHLN